MSHGWTRIHTDILALAIAAPMWAQAPLSQTKPYAPPRMADGHPDLQGTYDLATLTPLERASGAKAVLTKEEAARLEAMAALVRARGDQAISGERQAPPKGGDGSTGRREAWAATTPAGSIQAPPTPLWMDRSGAR